MTEDPKISQRYRELGREEPPHELDAAILAAARRAARTRPAPLVVPSGRQRWYFPLAAAAIIVLAVAVTMHVEREQPDPEAVVTAPSSAPEAPAEQKALQAEPPPALPKPAPSQDLRAQRDTAPLADLQKSQTPPASPVPPLAAELEPSSRQDAVSEMRQESRARASRQADGAPAVAGAMARSFTPASPEQWLQGIADLRRQGRHEEADKALAEFRKRYPDYKIPEAVAKTLEKRTQ
jgi:hypothetical protein